MSSSNRSWRAEARRVLIWRSSAVSSWLRWGALRWARRAITWATKASNSCAGSLSTARRSCSVDTSIGIVVIVSPLCLAGFYHRIRRRQILLPLDQIIRQRRQIHHHVSRFHQCPARRWRRSRSIEDRRKESRSRARRGSARLRTSAWLRIGCRVRRIRLLSQRVEEKQHLQAAFLIAHDLLDDRR